MSSDEREWASWMGGRRIGKVDGELGMKEFGRRQGRWRRWIGGNEWGRAMGMNGEGGKYMLLALALVSMYTKQRIGCLVSALVYILSPTLTHSLPSTLAC